MELLNAGFLFGAGIIGGFVNAVAGGGTFFTFPALLAAGLTPISANASSAVAIWPGHAATLPAYWRRLRAVKNNMPLRCLIAFFGGGVGAMLLLASGDRIFSSLIPWLLLFATLLFAFSSRIRALLLKTLPQGARQTTLFLAAEFAFAVYGGYFGAGLGILLLTSLTLLGHDDLQEANAIKNLLSAIISSVAVFIFILAAQVEWQPTLVTLAGAVTGGVAGARAAQRLSQAWLRRAVIAAGSLLTVVFFWRVYGLPAW
jgi:hypothetical protein